MRMGAKGGRTCCGLVQFTQSCSDMLVKPHDPAFKEAECQDIICPGFQAALNGCLNLSVFLHSRHHEIASGLNRREFLTSFLSITQLVTDHERSVDRQGFEDRQ